MDDAPKAASPTPTVKPVAAAAPAKPKMAWPEGFDPKKQGKHAAIKIPPMVWSLIHGTGDQMAAMRAGGVTPFAYPTTPPTETVLGELGSFARHVGAEDECQNCEARVSQVARQGLICIGCGSIRQMDAVEEN